METNTRRKSLGSDRARRMLREALESSDQTLAEVGRKMGYSTHGAIWQYAKGTSSIPLGSTYDLGLAVGMTPQMAREFFLINLEDRDAALYKVVLKVMSPNFPK